jgi:hypothetical protein
MVQRGEHLSFALESHEPIGIPSDIGRQNLDGHGASKVLVGGAVHLAHSALANLVDNFVWAEASAWKK